MGVTRTLRNIAEVHRRLRPHPGHFRELLHSTMSNVVRLSAIRRRAHASGRRLIAIGLIERLGDIVACTPIARKLRQDFPNDFIVWPVRPPFLDILAGNPDIDAAIPIHCMTELIWLKGRGLFDKTIDLHINMHRCTKCAIIYVSTDDNGISFSNYFSHGSIVRSHSIAAGYPVDDGQPSLNLDRSVVDAVDQLGLPKRIVAIHARSEEPLKDWNPHGWIGLANHVCAQNRTVVEVGLNPILRDAGLPAYVDLCGRCSPRESAEVIRRAELFVGIDSGPAHLANAVKTPGVVLLGCLGAFDRYFPYSGFYADTANCRAIHHDGPAAGIPLDLVCESVDLALLSASTAT